MLDGAGDRGVEGASLLSRGPNRHVELLHACVLLFYLLDSALQLLRGP